MALVAPAPAAQTRGHGREAAAAAARRVDRQREESAGPMALVGRRAGRAAREAGGRQERVAADLGSRKARGHSLPVARRGRRAAERGRSGD
jgi:hypothetical protein